MLKSVFISLVLLCVRISGLLMIQMKGNQEKSLEKETFLYLFWMHVQWKNIFPSILLGNVACFIWRTIDGDDEWC